MFPIHVTLWATFFAHISYFGLQFGLYWKHLYFTFIFHLGSPYFHIHFTYISHFEFFCQMPFLRELPTSHNQHT